MGWKQLQLMLKYSEDLATNVSVCARHFFWGTKHPTFFLDDFNIDKNNCTETTRHKLPYHVLKILQNVNKEPTKTEKKQNNPWPVKIVGFPRFPAVLPSGPAQIHRTKPCGRTSSACRVRTTRCFPRSVQCWRWASEPPASCCEVHAGPSENKAASVSDRPTKAQ